jgi:nucleoside-diphosphate-sugar epimerase
VRDASPTSVVHLLTSLPPGGALRARDLEATNTVRMTGTRNLLHAAIAAGARRLVAESFVAVYGNPDVDVPIGEDRALPAVPTGPFKDTVLALRDLERQLQEAAASGTIETIALRFGGLYGAGVPQTEGLIWQARAGKLMVPRGAPGLMSFVHIDDAVTATVRALDHGRSGAAYNVVDDTPMPAERYISEIANVYGARPPRRVPRLFLRWAAPVAAQLTSWRVPLSNAKARSELGWSPRYPSVRDGLRGRT